VESAIKCRFYLNKPAWILDFSGIPCGFFADFEPYDKDAINLRQRSEAVLAAA
jgi:hypothetical protein